MMQNIICENQTISSSSEPILMKPDNGQSKKLSDSQNVSSTTIKRPYGSMPNLTAAITTGGDTAAIQTPTAVTVQPAEVSTEPFPYCPTPIKLANYAGPQMRHYVNAATTVPPAAAEVEIRSPSVSSDRHVSAAPNHDGSGESDAKIRDSACRPRRLWCSMPNIAIHYTDKTLDDTEIECIALMPVSGDSMTYCNGATVTEPR
ncbi:unnamed protein product [Aphis gossypii]|uniref:Uncharacterized protein n=1 Tax=Aphis gossypii TaxID=80765 RepID=A0A9P0JIF9_APHGO|nr:unnamed protein product [Aphis gossypii]